MIQLQRHIEILLLENECVIVPDFGGFMTHEVPARYDEDDHSFLPPYRTLGFNPQLRINDSVLVQSYVEAYDISYPEALRRIEGEVALLKQQLSEQGSYELENLGVLTVNQDGNYEFTPGEAGVLSPALYGLANFSFLPLKDSHAMEEEKKTKSLPVADVQPTDTPLAEVMEQDDDADTRNNAVVIKMSWIRNAVAVAAAVVAFFLISTPITNSDLSTQTMSQLQQNLLYKLIPQDTNIVPVESVEAQVAEAAPAPVKKDVTPAVAESKSPSAPTYYIVVASQVKKSNADAYVEQLHKEGYQDARVMVRNDIVRVVCGSFTSMNDAYRQLNKMNVKEEFYEAWVYKDV